MLSRLDVKPVNTAKVKLLSSMAIFGTVGIFVNYIPLPSAQIAFCRAVLGFVFLLTVMGIAGKKPAWAGLRRNLPLLLLSGAALGGNWILLFEAYRHTGVPTSTACYYLAPMFLVLAAPLWKERLTARKLCCVGVAFIGMVLVSGVLKSTAQLPGILLAIGAAVLYACVMGLNKQLADLPAHDKTLVQLAVAALAILPYMLLSGPVEFPAEPMVLVLLGVVGIIHTGLAYWLYFGSVKALPTQTVAIFSYLDPAIAIVLSAVLLQQIPDLTGIAGCVLILGSALYCEFFCDEKNSCQ